MNLSDIIAFLAPFQALLKPELLQIEAAAALELKQLIQSNVSSPDLQALLVAINAALDEFAKIEIGKLG